MVVAPSATSWFALMVLPRALASCTSLARSQPMLKYFELAIDFFDAARVPIVAVFDGS